VDKKEIIFEHLGTLDRPRSASWIARNLKGIGFKTVQKYLRELFNEGLIKRRRERATSSQYGQQRMISYWYREKLEWRGI